MANEQMNKFFERFDALKDKYPDLYLQIKEYSREPRRWRIHVLGKSFSEQGDSEFVFVENMNREEAFKEALVRMGSIEEKIKNLNRISKYGTRFIQ